MSRIRDFISRNFEGFVTKLIYDVVKWIFIAIFTFLMAFLISKKWDFLGMMDVVGEYWALIIYLCMTVGAIYILCQIGRLAFTVAKRKTERSRTIPAWVTNARLMERPHECNFCGFSFSVMPDELDCDNFTYVKEAKCPNCGNVDVVSRFYGPPDKSNTAAEQVTGVDPATAVRKCERDLTGPLSSRPSCGLTRRIFTNGARTSMYLSDADILALTDVIAKHLRRSDLEDLLVRDELYSLAELSDHQGEFAPILIKSGFIVAVLEDLRARGKLSTIIASLHHQSAIPEKELNRFLVDEISKKESPKPSQRPMRAKSIAAILPPAFSRLRPDWRLIIGVFGLAIAILVFLYGNNLCQQPSPPEWTKPILSKICPTTATQVVHPTTTLPAVIPTIESTAKEPALPGSDWSNDCISSQSWITFSDPGPPKQMLPCWDLADWGIAASNGMLLIASEVSEASFGASTYTRRGIYTSFPRKATLSFRLRIDALRTEFADLLANLSVGVTPSNPFVATEGTLLIYQVESEDSPVHMKTSERGTSEDYLSTRYTYQEIHYITVEADQVSVSIFVNGNLLVGPSPIPQNPAFWIGYLLPKEGRIIARISDFHIQEK